MSLFANGVTELLRFADYRGRSTRTDLVAFWWVTFLGGAALLMVGAVFSKLAGFRFVPLTMDASLIYQWCLTIPMIALFARRMHDRGLSGWWIALCVPAAVQNVIADYYRVTGDFEAMLAQKSSTSYLISAIPLLAVFILLLLPGEEGPNRYGPNPRYEPHGEPA